MWLLTNCSSCELSEKIYLLFLKKIYDYVLYFICNFYFNILAFAYQFLKEK